VIWGSNLGLTLGERLTRVQADMTKLLPYVQQVMIGLILSDG